LKLNFTIIFLSLNLKLTFEFNMIGYEWMLNRQLETHFLITF
jgi:hypothetical protein